MRPFAVLVVYALSVLGLPAPAAAIVEIGHYEGDGLARAADVEGDVAILAGDDEAVLLDVSNPRWPRHLASIEVDGYVSNVALHGGVAFLANRELGLRILDVSDPRHPEELRLLPMPPDGVEAVAVRDGIAYVAALSGGLVLLDVSDPVHPVELGRLDTPGYAHGVELLGDLAYVPDYDSLRIVDLTDPHAPVEVGSLATPDGAVAMAASGQLACLAADVVEILDLSDPLAPVAVGTAPYSSHWVGIDGNHCLAWNAGTLRVLELSDPASPVETGSLGLVGPSIALSKGLAFAPAGRRGLAVVDYSRPDYPKKLAELELSTDFAEDVALHDSRLFATGSQGSFLVVDVGNPASLVEVGSLNGAPGRDVELGGGFAYVGGLDGLFTISLEDPTLPSLVQHAPGTQISDLTLDGGLLHAAGRRGLEIFDLSDPAAPLRLSYTDDRRLDADWVSLLGPTAFLTNGGRFPELRVLDISDPTSPTSLESGGWTFFPDHLAFRGQRAHASGLEPDATTAHLAVFDASDPVLPAEIGRVRLPIARPSVDLELDATRAFIALAIDDVFVADISEDAPVALGAIHVPSRLMDVEIHEGLLYILRRDGDVSNRLAAVQVYDLGPEYRPPRHASIDVKPGIEPNLLIPGRPGMVFVALLGGEELDVSSVDASTLAFGPHRAAARWVFRQWDLDRDGYRDLIARFRVDETGIALGDETACLRGSTLDGAPFRGCDDVRTRAGCGHGFELALLLPLGVLARRRRRSG